MKERLKKLLPWFLSLLPALVAALLFLGLRELPNVAEYVFSRGIFKVLSYPLDWLVSLYPWSLTELMLVLALPLLILLIVLTVRTLRRSGKRRCEAARLCRRLLAVVSSLLLFYMLMHGVNYYRLPLDTLLQIETGETFTAEELQAVCMDLAAKATAAREALPEDENGCVVLPDTLSETLKQADDGYRTLGKTWPFLKGSLWRVKPVQLSHWWSYTGISGMYFPLLAEANVNVDMPPWSIPVTAAHEVAHTRGIAREDECNFLAFLACCASEEPVYVYSGYLMTYIYCGNALYDHDPAMWQAARDICSPGVVADLRQQSAYWKQFEGEVKEASTAANNAFIQSQGVADGVLSYDRVVELVLKWYRAEGQI